MNFQMAGDRSPCCPPVAGFAPFCPPAIPLVSALNGYFNVADRQLHGHLPSADQRQQNTNTLCPGEADIEDGLIACKWTVLDPHMVARFETDKSWVTAEAVDLIDAEPDRHKQAVGYGSWFAIHRDNTKSPGQPAQRGKLEMVKINMREDVSRKVWHGLPCARVDRVDRDPRAEGFEVVREELIAKEIFLAGLALQDIP
jgi:hypothetical protein